MKKSSRPLSPHLQIYRPQLTSVMSTLHRISGGFLMLSSLLLVGWLLALASGPLWLDCYQSVFKHVLGRLTLIAISASYFYHLYNGIRHLMWDTGRGLDLTSVYQSGYLVLIATSASTAFLWMLILNIE